MRRPELAVAIPSNEHTPNNTYNITQSPSVFDKQDDKSIIRESITHQSIKDLDVTTPVFPEYTPPAPSIRLLYTFCTKQDLCFLILPAVFTSVLAGGMAPFMTQVIGQAFDAFAHFPLTPNPPQQAKRDLLRNVGFASLELIALAAGQLAFNSLMSSLWIWVGERNVMRLRKRVYNAVTAKSMTWFDLNLGGDAESVPEKLGAGGLMAKFSRETDDVRTASALTAGMIIQHLVTVITCMVLAFSRSWALTLVILSTVPLLVLVQAISQRYGIPMYERECTATGKAGSLLERAISNIATVKAFNATAREERSFNRAVDEVKVHANSSGTVWATNMGISQFLSMTLFIQAFGFGSKLVRDGKISPGDVMSVFWACLIGATSLQTVLPFLQTFAKGKMSMASLVAFIEQPTPTPPLPAVSNSPLKTANPFASGILIGLRGLRPAKCSGEFTLRNVTFAYPSRPDIPVLKDISIYLPAHEMTFIVGGSGSGKSTIAQLLLRMYEPQFGSIELDNQSFAHIDIDWAQRHIGAVNQGCVLFDMSVHDNVSMGSEATREQVVNACRVALMHEFVRDLPQGYETRLGTGGASLSGGQKQRLAIARAWIRDPTVLILDEATSALDATSRLLVFEAIKAWRKNKTTIVITHDLSQITPSDFVYLLKEGEVVEQGYRSDLELNTDGHFRAMADTQNASGFPEKVVEAHDEAEIEAFLEKAEEEAEAEADTAKTKWMGKHQSMGPTFRPFTGVWMFDVMSEIACHNAKHASALPTIAPRSQESEPARPPTAWRHSNVVSPVTVPPLARTHYDRRASLQFTPISPTPTSYHDTRTETDSRISFRSKSLIVEDDEEFERDKSAITSSGLQASKSRLNRSRSQLLLNGNANGTGASAVSLDISLESAGEAEERPQSVIRVLRNIFPGIPNKPLVTFGLLTCLLSGAMTPIFSFVLSRLFFEVSSGAHSVPTIVKYALITLALAAGDGFLACLKSILMENAAVAWMTKMRKMAFIRVLAQDKSWFDNPANNPARLVNVLVKDADDAKRLLSVCLGMFVVVASMLSLGLVWALVWGWQLTLVGIAIVPVFAGAMSFQARMASKFQLRNKRAREELSKVYYEAISNIRGIRSMSFQHVFASQFDAALSRALRTGVKGAFVEGTAFGVTNAMIYLSEALLFYVGAILVAKGTYTYLQMVQVLNLLVFSVTIAAQMMVFIDKIAKSSQAAHDLHKVLSLGTETQESKGSLCPTITGRVSFRDVSFAYPQRPDVPILKGFSLDLKENESVAIVGSSGSGKSTVAGLLQRLYEPDHGSISVGKTKLSSTNVTWLREHISVVSQSPHLFDTTIHENIAYGASEFPFAQVRRAAKSANVHEFIMSLPRDYNTSVGENASLISGGQAQRLQIARALVRPCNILILDECTSALDAANQTAVMDTIQRVKVGRTTVLITHKIPLMRMCDRIVVMQDGAVVEQGTFESLMEQRGPFFKLANAGEWSTDP
ncbi:P-loop containing nucleoside triphosphate hydrolase protein [Hysterangium stoloniferum]|nr:P-loop containing nucleoside triphosphate hydrolase protein [Hysterangium stoloniferum]